MALCELLFSTIGCPEYLETRKNERFLYWKNLRVSTSISSWKDCADLFSVPPPCSSHTIVIYSGPNACDQSVADETSKCHHDKKQQVLLRLTYDPDTPINYLFCTFTPFFERKKKHKQSVSDILRACGQRGESLVIVSF